jgi:hypothetical protein
VTQEDAYAQGEKEAENAKGAGKPPTWALGVSLGEHFFQNIGNPVVDRVAEPGQEFVLGAESGWTAAGPRLAAFTGQPETGMIVDSSAGGRHQVRSFRVQRNAEDCPGPGRRADARPASADRYSTSLRIFCSDSFCSRR